MPPILKFSQWVDTLSTEERIFIAIAMTALDNNELRTADFCFHQLSPAVAHELTDHLRNLSQHNSGPALN